MNQPIKSFTNFRECHLPFKYHVEDQRSGSNVKKLGCMLIQRTGLHEFLIFAVYVCNSQMPHNDCNFALKNRTWLLD